MSSGPAAVQAVKHPEGSDSMVGRGGCSFEDFVFSAVQNDPPFPLRCVDGAMTPKEVAVAWPN